jgi:hypothetical protein
MWVLDAPLEEINAKGSSSIVRREAIKTKK